MPDFEVQGNCLIIPCQKLGLCSEKVTHLLIACYVRSPLNLLCVIFLRSTAVVLLSRMHHQTMQILSVLKISVYGNMIFFEICYCKNYDQVMTKISKGRGFSKQGQVWNISASFFLLCTGTSFCSNLRSSVSTNSSEFIWQIYLCQPQDLYAISYCSFWCLYLTDLFPICLVHLFIFGKLDLSCFYD